MILFMLLGQAAAVASKGDDASVYTPKATINRSIALPIADRPRGVDVYDASGAPVGTIHSSDADSIILLVGGRPFRVPANALRKVNGRLIAPMTRQQVEMLWSGSASYQERVHAPAPEPGKR